MTKLFFYFESQEGGMGVITFSDPTDLKSLYGWMRAGCVKKDEELLAWIGIAEVGEIFNHRLGYCVRMLKMA